jgi:hypothetical protein
MTEIGSQGVVGGQRFTLKTFVPAAAQMIIP